MMICLFIWFDYLNKFRGPDSYITQKKLTNGTISTIFDADVIDSFGGMYDFYKTKPQE